MSESEDVVMILLPVAGPNQRVAAGSAQMTAKCGHRVWIAPSGVDYLAQNSNVRTSCMACTDPSEIAPAQVQEIPGQMDEIRAELTNSPNDDQLLAMLRALFSPRD